MANLKLDLLNKINNDKYFEELELVRLASDPNMNYQNKIDWMSNSLREIAIFNAQLGLVEEYFKESSKPATKSDIDDSPQTTIAPPVAPAHQGQSHGE